MKTKFLYRQVSPYIITQKFGENRVCVLKSDWDNGVKPPKIVSESPDGACSEGYMKLYPLLGMSGHTGNDLFAKRWQPVYARQNGVVKEVSTELERGLGTGIITDNKYNFFADDGLDHFAKYRDWHFIALNVVLNQKVKVGDLIGWADSTGYSAGDHVHSELKPVEYNSDGTYYNVLQNNGFYGAVNETPYTDDYFALDALSILQRASEALAKLADWISELLRKRSLNY